MRFFLYQESSKESEEKMIKSPCTSSGQQLGAGIMSSLDTPQHVTSLDQEIIKLDAALQACCEAAAH